MQHNILGRTGRTVSSVGLGTWQLGADWGAVSEADAFNVLDASAEAGVSFFDTADVYGDGRSEQLIGQWRRQNPDWAGTVATKMIRRAPEPSLAYATEANFREWTDRSRRNLGTETLDLEPATAAIAWAAQQTGVSTVIPGARNPEQARSNATAGTVHDLPETFLQEIQDLYDSQIRAEVHHRW